MKKLEIGSSHFWKNSEFGNLAKSRIWKFGKKIQNLENLAKCGNQ